MKRLLLALLVAAPAHAQWTVTYLQPPGARYSRAWSVRDGQQVGQVFYPGNVSHAGHWSGTAASWVDLNPAPMTNTWARGVAGGQQVGVEADNAARALFWSGTAASWVDLTPVGGGANANNMDASQQVGWVVFNGGPAHAGYWTGTAASWVDLHPAAAPGVVYSAAMGVYAGQQVGYAGFGGQDHAGRWTGTASSWVDLHPAGALNSRALAVFGTQQVGQATLSGNFHASLWTGTAASWVDLNPAGSSSSVAYAVWDGWQAGWARIGNEDRAGVWNGAAGTWEDLSSVLPGEWGSNALGIWSDAYTQYVVGYGATTDGVTQALMWTRPIAGACYTNCDRSTTAPVLNIFDFLCFMNKLASGDAYANCDGSSTPPVLNIFDFTCFLNRFATGCS